jgi:hypothetical protein
MSYFDNKIFSQLKDNYFNFDPAAGFGSLSNSAKELVSDGIEVVDIKSEKRFRSFFTAQLSAFIQ